MPVVASVTVTVQKSSADQPQYDVSAEVYKKLDGGTYESSSQFEPGDTAYIGLFKLPAPVTYSLTTTVGNLKSPIYAVSPGSN